MAPINIETTMIKEMLPYPLKVSINLVKNKILDLFNHVPYAAKSEERITYHGDVELTQEIKESETNSAKVQNFKIAIAQIEQIVIHPNEVFSFWRTVGSPSKKQGFKESRSIVNGTLVPTYGGGLCQLSGLIYFASLCADLEIMERHNHSTDIYTNETRFTPLGSDATVVFGFKDFKVRNNLTTPIRFKFILEKDKLTIRLNSNAPLRKVDVKFLQNENDANEILTYVDQKLKTKSMYRTINV